ncbi:cytochrome P450 [Comamonadaceae bacterium G21597-S1]|nr:cytochrome P450 [Comamonadaceae bacterium G21597-S1]
MKSLDNIFADPNTYRVPQKYYELMAQLRREDPVHWTEPDGIRPFWLVTKHADIVEVERRTDAFSCASRISMKTIEAEERIHAARKGASGKELMRSMNAMDGEEHRLYRNILQKDFLRPNVERLAAQTEGIAVEFVQRLIDRGPECDFVREISRWYPLRVIMTLLGVPAGEESKLLHLTELLFAPADKDVQNEHGAQEQTETIKQFFDYFRPLLEDRRRQPRDDLLSKIANARIKDEPIGDFEALSYCVTVATAGHDTTAASISGGLLALIEHPQEMQKLRDNPEVLKTATEEMIRWVAPVKHFFRTATKDLELRGRQIKAGDSVMVAFPSGCRDEDVFEDPMVFRVDRQPNPHTAMGHGVHVCLGQHLARLEIGTFFKQFLSRIASVELAGDPVWLESAFISGPKRLPIRFQVRSDA